MKNLFFLLLILPLTSCGKNELNWLILSPNNIEGLTNLKFLLSGLTTTIYISIVSIIGIGDLTRKANELVVTTYRPLEIYTFLIFEYLVLILIVSFFVRKLENKLKKD